MPFSSTPDNTTPNILIVEDDPDISASLQHDLQQAGYQTIHADTVRQALTSARRHLPDLVLLDLTLPGGNGNEVLLRLIRIPISSCTKATSGRGYGGSTNQTAFRARHTVGRAFRSKHPATQTRCWRWSHRSGPTGVQQAGVRVNKVAG
ncbi:response regulator transcription factor [Deinococcus radiomollis]|uniref:response regulator transcription factor n=1 Tax=Deinococcus radiomollis TaxID=468916 RepID=UPI003891F80C